VILNQPSKSKATTLPVILTTVFVRQLSSHGSSWEFILTLGFQKRNWKRSKQASANRTQSSVRNAGKSSSAIASLHPLSWYQHFFPHLGSKFSWISQISCLLHAHDKGKAFSTASIKYTCTAIYKRCAWESWCCVHLPLVTWQGKCNQNQCPLFLFTDLSFTWSQLSFCLFRDYIIWERLTCHQVVPPSRVACLPLSASLKMIQPHLLISVICPVSHPFHSKGMTSTKIKSSLTYALCRRFLFIICYCNLCIICVLRCMCACMHLE